MGLYNTHGMVQDDEWVQEALEALGLMSDEMEALVEHWRKEEWVWSKVAQGQKGQKKRKSNLVAKFCRLRKDKWIELMAEFEMEYEHEHGIFSSENTS